MVEKSLVPVLKKEAVKDHTVKENVVKDDTVKRENHLAKKVNTADALELNPVKNVKNQEDTDTTAKNAVAEVKEE